jgi:ferredoxin--NADP+ reductase/benzoate/toluate 1,2-dioxygenase reductase subunit
MLHAVIENRQIHQAAFILRFERNGLEFIPGQHLLAGEAGSPHIREYSVYSGLQDPFFEILVREVPDGMVSRRLRKLRPGDFIQIEGPVGYFTLDKEQAAKGRFIFIATGTGIAPFHSMARSYPGLSFTLVHGTRFANEDYGKTTFPKDCYIQCTSRDINGDFQGRVTKYIAGYEAEQSLQYYLCGNSRMIMEASGILRSKGIPPGDIHTEVYF